MKKISSTRLIALLVVLACTACKKEPNAYATDLPVVEAYLLPDHELSVKVYQQKELSDTAQYGAAITGLKLSVSNGSQTIQLTESKPGTYTYNDKTYIAPGATYMLNFSYLSYQVSAQTTIPQKPTGFSSQFYQVGAGSSPSSPGTVDTLNTFKWANPAGLHHILVFKCLSGKGFPINNMFGTTRPANFTFNAGQAANYYITAGAFAYYGDYQVILMCINKEYGDRLQNTGNTSQNLSNAPTNVKNGLGIFTGMHADTVVIKVI